MISSATALALQQDGLFRLAIESSPGAIVLVNSQGEIAAINAKAENLFGYARYELTGKPVEVLLPDSSREGHPQLRAQFAVDPQFRSMAEDREVYARRKDGSLVPVEIRLNPIPTENGLWVLTSMIDVSKRRRAEAKLCESEDRFKNMANTAPVMVWVSGVDKSCTFVNRGWLEFRGRTLEQELGDGWADGLHPDDRRRCLEIYYTAFDLRRTFQMEYRLRRADGEYRWIVDNGVPRFDSSGVFVGFVGSCVDITEIKRAQEHALEHQKLESLGLLARGVGHDFNNLQSAIIMLAEVMLERPNLDPLIAKELGEIRDIALRGSELTRQLTTYAGGDIADVGPLNVADIAAEIRKLLEVSIGKRARLELRLAKNVPPVLANAGHIRQILLNLAVNAAEAIEAKKPGIITVTVSRFAIDGIQRASGSSPDSREYVKLEVSDTGRGIPSQLQTKIFDPFFTTKSGGRGLGLSVVHGIVRRYGGVLSVRSVPDEGTRFEILLPRAPAPDAKADAEPATSQPLGLRNQRA